ncbi:hypothetical protein PVIIG_06431, partial [Plasmodium vivax India VII]
MAAETNKDIFNYVSFFQKNKESYDQVTSNYDNTHRSACNYINSKVYDDYLFVSTCVKIARYLTHINYESQTKNVKDKCEYLNYFINSNINAIKPDVIDTSNLFNKIISEFNEHLNSEIKICLKNMKHINKNELKDLQILMDLFGNFEKFKEINKEKDVNCSFGEECVKLYMDSLDKCKDNNNTKFCNILEEFNKHYNEEAPTLDYCKNVQ